MSVLKRKRPTKHQIEIQQQYKNKDPIALECSKCWRTVENLNADTSSVICSYCVQGMVDPPEIRNTKETGRPRGWQFRAKYRAPDGTLYSRGKIVNESTNSTKNSNRRTDISKKTADSVSTDNIKSNRGKRINKSNRRTGKAK